MEPQKTFATGGRTRHRKTSKSCMTRSNHDTLLQAIWMEQAALKDDVKGMFGTGVCYSAAFGRAQDNTTALRWFCKAAKHVRVNIGL